MKGYWQVHLSQQLLSAPSGVNGTLRSEKKEILKLLRLERINLNLLQLEFPFFPR
jgi:hypothetical protein